MGQAAIDAAKALDYFNAGTVEFLLDRDGNFYFIENHGRRLVSNSLDELGWLDRGGAARGAAAADIAEKSHAQQRSDGEAMCASTHGTPSLFAMG
jgi:hypothetical protein